MRMMECNQPSTAGFDLVEISGCLMRDISVSDVVLKGSGGGLSQSGEQ